MSISITAEQRNVLFAQALLNVSVVDDFQRAIGSGDTETAYKAGRRASDGLRLILDAGLGLTQRITEPVTINLAGNDLRPIISRMRWEVAAAYESRRPEFEAFRREEDEVVGVRDACRSILEQT